MDPNSPFPQASHHPEPNPAADVIRAKISALHENEPDAREELREANAATMHRSRHQQYMFELSRSGRSLAEIQTAWHTYYINLTDAEKHEVWQEFYTEHARTSRYASAATQHPQPQAAAQHPAPEHTSLPAHPAHRKLKHRKKHRTESDHRTVEAVKQQLLGTVQQRSKISKKQHLKSLAFGLSAGVITLFILLFGFFNERFIAPFITPSRQVSNTPIIIDPNSTAASKEPLLVIPKINVEVPVIYTEPSIEEKAVQKALENGVLHYATTPNPGEDGNAVYFGHSSSNILNRGKYKFAFVLLKSLEIGDTFMLQKDGKRYIYRVYEKKVVAPTEVSVLDKTDKRATATLITCDPPGTSVNRLVIIGEQITPDPINNVASTATQETGKPAVLPSNSVTLWQRVTSWL